MKTAAGMNLFGKNVMAVQIGMLLGCLVLALLLREASETIGSSSGIFDKLAGRRFDK